MPVVYWWNSEGRGSWSCAASLNQMFDLYGCEHRDRTQGITGSSVVVINGGDPKVSVEEVNRALWPLSGVIIAIIGAEAAELDSSKLEHPNSVIWYQTSRRDTYADRYMIEGAPAGTRRYDEPRNIDYFFAGQVTHPRRQACWDAMHKMAYPNALVWGTRGFGQGMSQELYLTYMSRARVVPCPSGPTSPDTFRIWEALECGAVPIVDARSIPVETEGFWERVIPDSPLTFIENWSTLPEVMEELLGNWEYEQRLTQYWWKKYKVSSRDWLAKDLISLGAYQ